jgi:hypothetical protein
MSSCEKRRVIAGGIFESGGHKRSRNGGGWILRSRDAVGLGGEDGRGNCARDQAAGGKRCGRLSLAYCC